MTLNPYLVHLWDLRLLCRREAWERKLQLCMGLDDEAFRERTLTFEPGIPAFRASKIKQLVESVIDVFEVSVRKPEYLPRGRHLESVALRVAFTRGDGPRHCTDAEARLCRRYYLLIQQNS